MKWFYRTVLIAVVAVFMVAAGGFLLVRTSLPQISGEIDVAGLSQPVEIIRDRNGITHIRAKSETDAYFALGFVHAQDRLFQMDFQRRIASGRLSEVVGENTLELDRLMRTLGLRQLAAVNLDHLSPEARAALDAYSAGVNAHLDAHPGALPPEFLALMYRPERWRPADSLLWGRLMALRLSGNWRAEALRAGLSGKLTPEQIEDLWPRYDGEAPATLSALPPPALSPLFARLLDSFPDSMRRITASNSWLLGGRHTATGRPILANDPHLGFQAPNLWYLAHIEAPGLSVTGATVPGVPFTILGHNDRIAWGFTTTESDTQDLYIERLADGSEDEYETPAGPRPFVSRDEIIRVDGKDPVRHKVRATRHGPVLSDISPGLAEAAGERRVIALAAAAFRDDDRTAEAIYRLNHARDWTSFRDAMRNFHSPQQNISYADVDGNIGFVAPARVPVRNNGGGLVPVPGWTGEYDWQGFIPFEELPQTYNPAAGRIVSANHRVAPVGYRHYLGRIRTPPYRAERIHQMLDANPRHRIKDSAALQGDTLSLMVRDLKPLLTSIRPNEASAREALALVKSWDGVMDRGRPEPLIFVAWLRQLNRRLYADELDKAFPRYWGLRPAFVRRALTQRRMWCDDVTTGETESCGEIIERALSEAVAELRDQYGGDLAGWRWGDAHYARFRHVPFGWIPVINRLFDIRISSDGGAYTVNRAQMRIGSRQAPYASVHGPGFRAIYDLSNLDNSRFIQATGQSGNFLSSRFADLNERWRNGRYLRIRRSREAALEGATGSLSLRPRP